jgi:predicted O-linked N-acetylglucosamine transferase (SPINDLY family)
MQPDFDPLAAEILRRDPQGQLLLIEDKEPTITSLLRRRLQRTMPDVIDRVRFLSRLPEADYLGLVGLAEVILDTLPYSGGANTTYDAFAAGTPIVTLPGRFHRGRYTAAAYRQIGLTECIAASPDDYIDLALRLGRDPAYRARVSADIRQACPALFEDKAAVRELANFFEEALAQV